MTTIKPAPYSNTDAAEQDALITFNSLINTRYVKADIRTRDKVPNVDGTIELVDERQVPYGKLDVQLRKLPAGKTSYSCPSSLVAYSTVSTLPIILICADPDFKKVFWRKISATMPEYISGQDSFTIHFDEVSDSLDAGEVYLQKWAEIVHDYKERVSKYPVLKREIANRLTLKGIAPQDRELFQRYIGAINNLLNNDFVVVKELRFPDVWQLGVGLFDVTPQHVSYQLYKIPYGEADPPICKLEGGSLLSASPNPYAISDLSMSRDRFSDPQAVGQRYVLGLFEELVQRKALPVHGIMLSTDVLLGFIDRYYRCLGLHPQQDVYQVADINYAFNRHLVELCAAIVVATSKDKSNFVHLDLDSVNTYVANNDVNPIPPSATPIRFGLGARRISVPAVITALRFLTAASVTTITRLLAPRTQISTPGTFWIWEGYSPNDEIRNVSLVLEKSLDEYTTFVRGNRLNLPQSVYLDANIAVVYEYKPAFVVAPGSSPEIREHFVDNSHHLLPKFSFRVLANNDTGISVERYPMLTIEEHEYRAISSSNGDASFLFHEFPFVTMIYRMLYEDLKKHYDIGLMSQYW